MTITLQDTALHGTIMEIGSIKEELIVVENPPVLCREAIRTRHG